MVLVLCRAESQQGAPQTLQSTVIVLEGLVGPPLRPTWLCAGFLVTLKGVSIVLVLNETERTAWEVREKRKWEV